MIDSYFNTFNKEIQNQYENKTETKDKRKTLVIIMIMIIGQTMCILNTLINNFTIQTFKIAYPLLYYGGFFFLFFIIWICINRKISSPKRYYYLIIVLETQSFFSIILQIIHILSKLNQKQIILRLMNNQLLMKHYLN